jgi:CheY-like chemotaxis protein
VLVVDDEPTVRMLVTEVLAELGYTAIEASDGKEDCILARARASTCWSPMSACQAA